MKTLGFGWEIDNVNNNGANCFFPVQNPITITGLNLDMGFMATGNPPPVGFAEVLCCAMIMPGLPTFGPGPQRYNTGPNTPQTDFGAVQFNNGAAQSVHGGITTGSLATVILKTNVGSDTRNLTLSNLNIFVPSGSYIVLHMDHAGIPGDCEMQGVLFYQ